MRIKEFFHDNPSENVSNPFKPESLWTPPSDRDNALNTFLNAVEHDLLTTKPCRVRDNLPKQQRRALHQLKRRRDIVIKSADAGSGTVIMDRTRYLDECNRQLNNPTFYELQTNVLTDNIHVQKRVTLYVKRMFNITLLTRKLNKIL